MAYSGNVIALRDLRDWLTKHNIEFQTMSADTMNNLAPGDRICDIKLVELITAHGHVGEAMHVKQMTVIAVTMFQSAMRPTRWMMLTDDGDVVDFNASRMMCSWVIKSRLTQSVVVSCLAT